MKPANVHPSLSPKENLAILRRDPRVYFTNTGPRDTGQSDFKNRHTLHDLIKLAPMYNQSGYFSIENHGGARFHQNLLQNKIDPFEEAALWKQRMPDVMTQTLVRSTNLWGYRMYPRNVAALSVKAFLPYVDVWRCFDFLNYVPNMIPIAEEVMKGGKIFEPAISFSVSDDCTNAYYLKVTRESLAITGGAKEIILCIKDMAGVGSPKRIASLVDALLQKHPSLVIHYHRHTTDGLAVPALVAAAKAGVKILDVTDDPFTRYYGHAPVRSVNALLQEQGIQTRLDLPAVDESATVVADFIGHYHEFESQFRGFSYKVTEHRMPGGAFPSSFEQAGKGDFLHLMPHILRGMSYGNKFIKYFDVTPGSQITWTTWVGIVQFHYKEGGYKAVESLLGLCERFIAVRQRLEKLSAEERERLLGLYAHATDDLKSLLLGRYGPLPFGWPADWVYQSVFGDAWREKIKKERIDASPLAKKKPENIPAIQRELEGKLGRSATPSELVLYLQHPGAAVDFLAFRRKFGDTSLLPTPVWFDGLKGVGNEVRFEHHGKPTTIKLVSIGAEVNGMRHMVLAVNNTMHVFPVDMPSSKERHKVVARMADPAIKGEIGSPMMGNVWRIGDKERTLKVGDIVREGQEIMNLEAMKIETAILSPMHGVIKEIPVRLNEAVVDKQLLMVLGEVPWTQTKRKAGSPKRAKK
ncbi:MAG TPA: biotin/lipoyl-containing protein [Nitrospiria bacterium]|nr:biotin/lipoyl-containing protein [Nitrospiria bacterium]